MTEARVTKAFNSRLSMAALALWAGSTAIAYGSYQIDGPGTLNATLPLAICSFLVYAMVLFGTYRGDIDVE